LIVSTSGQNHNNTGGKTGGMGSLDDLAGRGYVMEHIYTAREQFILNNRSLFDVEQDQLIDLESHISSTTLNPVAARILALPPCVRLLVVCLS
jgi:hypothetical protein